MRVLVEISGPRASFLIFVSAAKRQAVQAQINPKRLGESPRPARKFFYVARTAPLHHYINPAHRLGGADEHSAYAIALCRDIQAIVHPINQVYINVAERFAPRRSLSAS